jgi:hypothetical protein
MVFPKTTSREESLAAMIFMARLRNAIYITRAAGLGTCEPPKNRRSTRELFPEEVTSRLQAEAEELLELATFLEQGNVDPAALQQFRQALACVRSTAGYCGNGSS